MCDMDQTTFFGYITKKEIVLRLQKYGLMAEEYLEPIKHLRETQFINIDTENYYKKLFERTEESNFADISSNSQEDQIENNSSYTSDNNLDYDSDSELNDTLAEMEAFLSHGVEYSQNELEQFYPTSNNENINHFQIPQNTYKENEPSNILKSVLNQNAIKNTDFIKRSLENLYVSEQKTPIKYKFGSENDLVSPEILYTPNENKTPKSISQKLKKENINPSLKKSNEIFKTPLPKTNYKNIVSPISRYISHSPSVPLLKKIVPKTVPVSEHEFKKKIKPQKFFKPLPQICYEPSKIQQVTMTERESPLPKSLNKYISKPVRPEIIKHKGRINNKNQFEEYCERYMFDTNVEDLSEIIDNETSRFIEMSVLVSSEAKFSSELK